MEHPSLLVAEMARVCKPGGWLIISTLDDTCDAAQAHGDYPEHLWSFTPDELLGYFRPYGTPTYELVGHYHMVYCQKR
jgi:2-polyprenyl-3-methyl-5-hydroxy-6-metoxy-1,4-benzoquinol methylase